MLTLKQKAFVAEYLIDLNGTQAAIRAGYSAKTAKEQASRLLTNVHVQAALKIQVDKRANKLEITAERVLQEFAKVAFGNMLDYTTLQADGTLLLDFSRLTREQASVIQSIETEERMDRTGEYEDGKPVFERIKKTKFKLHDKLSALVQLGRHLKIFEGEMDSGDRLDQLMAALKRAPYQPAARVN